MANPSLEDVHVNDYCRSTFAQEVMSGILDLLDPAWLGLFSSRTALNCGFEKALLICLQTF